MAPKASVENTAIQTKGLAGSDHSTVGSRMAMHDEHAAHGGRAGLLQVRLRPVLANVLADLELAQLLDHPGPMNSAISSAVSEAKAVRNVR